MPTTSPLIFGLGEILWDLLPSGRQLGGAPANFAFHAHVLGARASVISAVGDDDLGKAILDRVDGLGVGVDGIEVDTDHPTGTVEVQVDGSGQPRYVIHENVAWDFIPWSDHSRHVAAQADAVCFGSLCQRSMVSRQTVGAFLEATRPSCLRVFDINLRQHFFDAEVIRESLRLSNVCKLNDEELPVVARLLGLPGDENSVTRTMLKQFDLQLIALTRGGKGSLLQTPAEQSVHPGVPAKVIDTVGAGDAFTAAVVVGMLAGHRLDQINERANRVASYVCSQPGATPRVPPHVTRAAL